MPHIQCLNRMFKHAFTPRIKATSLNKRQLDHPLGPRMPAPDVRLVHQVSSTTHRAFFYSCGPPRRDIPSVTRARPRQEVPNWADPYNNRNLSLSPTFPVLDQWTTRYKQLATLDFDDGICAIEKDRIRIGHLQHRAQSSGEVVYAASIFWKISQSGRPTVFCVCISPYAVAGDWESDWNDFCRSLPFLVVFRLPARWRQTLNGKDRSQNAVFGANRVMESHFWEDGAGGLDCCLESSLWSQHDRILLGKCASNV